MIPAKPEQGAGEFEQAEVVLRLLVPTNQDRAALREPGQRPFQYPSARLVGLRSGRALVTNERDVRVVVVIDAGAPAVLVVVALVEAQVLRPSLLDGLGTVGRVGA